MKVAAVVRRILVINPNTSAPVTEQVLRCCRGLHAQVAWQGVTARLGAPYIATETAYALAGHAVLEAYAEHFDGHDAVLLACFGDPGLLALQELAPVPVVGLAQASLAAAATHGPFGVVTGGAAWEAMLWRFARAHRLDARLTGIHTVALSGAEIAADPGRAIGLLLQACTRAIDAGAGRILLGGAALAGLAATLQPHVPVPVLDNVALGAQAVVDNASARVSESPTVPLRLPLAGAGAALTALLGGN